MKNISYCTSDWSLHYKTWEPDLLDKKHRNLRWLRFMYYCSVEWQRSLLGQHLWRTVSGGNRVQLKMRVFSEQVQLSWILHGSAGEVFWLRVVSDHNPLEFTRHRLVVLLSLDLTVVSSVCQTLASNDFLSKECHDGRLWTGAANVYRQGSVGVLELCGAQLTLT